MEFFDKITEKATKTYKGAAEKTGKIAKETKLRIKINENKSKINEIYKEIGKKVYQKHASDEEVCIKKDLEEECAKIDILSNEIESYDNEILSLSNLKECVECKEKIKKDAKFCTKCGAKQPEEEKQEAVEVEILNGEESNSKNSEDKEENEVKKESNVENSENKECDSDKCSSENCSEGKCNSENNEECKCKNEQHEEEKDNIE